MGTLRIMHDLIDLSSPPEENFAVLEDLLKKANPTEVQIIDPDEPIQGYRMLFKDYLIAALVVQGIKQGFYISSSKRWYDKAQLMTGNLFEGTPERYYAKRPVNSPTKQ